MTDMEKSQYNELVSLLEGSIRGGIFAHSSEILNALSKYDISPSVISDLKLGISDLILREQEMNDKITMPDSERVIWNYLLAACTSSLLFVPSFIALVFFRPLSLSLALSFLTVFGLSFGLALYWVFKMIRLIPAMHKDKLDYNIRYTRLNKLHQECFEARECLADTVHKLIIED